MYLFNIFVYNNKEYALYIVYKKWKISIDKKQKIIYNYLCT